MGFNSAFKGLNNEIPNTERFEIFLLPQLKRRRQKRIALDLLDKASKR